ncbi:MAG: hypothetical protein ACSHXD_20135 [Marinosulfonomonas sp.]
MLNDWSDRAPRGRRPFIMSGEFWLGVATTMIIVALVVSAAVQFV